MLRICTRTMVNVGMLYPYGLVKSCHLVKSVSASLVTGRYFTHQTGLPSLPVPPLQQTCEYYLSLLEPIVEMEELKRTKELVEEFQKAGGVGERLQRSLEMKARNTDNWSTGYMQHILYDSNRVPLVVHSNVGAVFPQMDFKDKDGQTRFVFNDRSCMFYSETLPVEYMGGKPMCMKQYSQMLSSCRIPGLEKDSLVFHGKSSNPPKHITVVHNSQFFVLDVYNSDGTPLTVDQLNVQLERICNSSPEINAEPVGILTTLDRDSWSKAYISLIKDKINKDSLSTIERSICTVCLDGPIPQASDEMYNTYAGLQIMHGGGSQWNSANRWFDKTLQLIIGEEGAQGFNMSHSAADGTVFMVLADYVIASMKKPEKILSPVVPLPKPQKLHFNITPDIKKYIEEAKQSMDIIAQNLDLRVMVFSHYGKKVLKDHKISPDAFIQMAIQLAYYRMYQRCCPSYEAASLRTFRDGRVAAIYSTTSASAAFVKAFDDPKKKNTEKVDLLEKAMKLSTRQTSLIFSIHQAISGQEVDGHLIGLRMQAVEEEISMPDVFTDISFHKFLDCRLSTSQVTSKSGCLPCAGPALLESYDMCYSLTNVDITFVVTAYHTCKENNAAQLIQVLENALLDMRALLAQSPRTN
uniref:Choline/carnitine acyltransferase domain-containing protein n=1 Tax=Amphiprion ocellaris TaxID=80972 RepID=A0AAQ6ARI9_AMPOC